MQRLRVRPPGLAGDSERSPDSGRSARVPGLEAGSPRQDMTQVRAIVFDSVHPAALARFWAEALDGYAVRAYDAAEIAGLTTT